MTEIQKGDDPRRPQAFRVLSEILAEAKMKNLQLGDVFRESKSALQDIGYAQEECAQLLNQFLAGEVSSSMTGGYTQLPELSTFPKGSWERKRITSFAWWYAQFRINDRSVGREDHAFKRAWFEFGNTNEESLHLLKWADANLGRIASIFAEGIVSGELSTYHIPTLATFIAKATEGTLTVLDLSNKTQNPTSD